MTTRPIGFFLLVTTLACADSGEDPLNTASELSADTQSFEDVSRTVLIDETTSFDGGRADVPEFPHRTSYELPRASVRIVFRLESVQGTQGLFSKDATDKGAGGHLSVYAENRDLVVRQQDTSVSITIAVPGAIRGGTTHDVVVTVGPRLEVYLDGELVGERDFAQGLDSNTEPLVVGGLIVRNPAGTFPVARLESTMVGSIVRAEIFGDALSAGQVRSLHQPADGPDDPPAPDPSTLIDADFESSAQGFSYRDGGFGFAAKPRFASGRRTAGTLEVTLGGVNNDDITNMAGRWTRQFTTSSPATVTLELEYSIDLVPDFERDERAEVRAAVDGESKTLIGISGLGRGLDPSDDAIRMARVQFDVGSSGQHTFDVGGVLNKKTTASERAVLRFDDVRLFLDEADEPEPPPPTDSSMATGELYTSIDFPIALDAVPRNPFDVVAIATFTHESGEVRETEAFYDGESAFVFRLGGSRVGVWRGRTSSDFSALDGIELEARVRPSSNPRRVGFTGVIASDRQAWAHQSGGNGRLERFVPILIMWDHPSNFWNDRARTTSNVEVFEAGHGFNGAHVPGIASAWFDVNSNRDLSEGDTRPDPRTFDALETLIREWSERGGHVMLQMWNQRGAQPYRLANGPNGNSARRLLRYIAARLGPVPGWSMEYGIDLDEWAYPAGGPFDDFHQWQRFLADRMGWHHYLGGRYSQRESDAVVNQGEHPPAGIEFNSQPLSGRGFAGWEHHQQLTTNREFDESLAVVPDRPGASLDRFRLRDQNRVKDFASAGEILTTIPRLADRGIAAIYGRYIGYSDLFRISEEWPNAARIKDVTSRYR